MADETLVVNPEDGNEEEPQEPKTFDADYVKDLRKEAANYRTKLRALEQEQKEAEDSRLAEQAEWQKLAEQRANEIEELSPYKERYDNMVSSVAESNTRRVEAVPEAMRGLVPSFDDPLKLASWLDANSQLLTKPVAPALNGESGGGTRPSETETLSAEQLAYANKMGVSPKEYLEQAKRG